MNAVSTCCVAYVRATFISTSNVACTFEDFKCVRKVDVSGFRQRVLINSSTLTKSIYIHFPNTFEIPQSTHHVHQPNERGVNVRFTFMVGVNVVCTFGESKCVRKVDVSRFRHKLYSINQSIDEIHLHPLSEHI